MQTSQYPFLRFGFIVLEEADVHSKVPELAVVKRFEKISPFILKYIRFDYQQALQRGFDDFHN
jgi:hypothetical protein